MEKPSKPFAMPDMLATTSLCLLASCMLAAPLSTANAEEAKKRLPTVTVEADKSAKAKGGFKTDESSSPKYTQPLLDTPQTVNVVPKAVIEERGAASLAEALRNVTGVSLAAGEGGTPNGDNLTLRGFNARNDIFIDGARDVGGYFRDSFNLESVEVGKGPSSSYAGRGSTGGTINQISKAPKLDDFIGATVAAGTDETKRLTLDVNQKLDMLDLEGAAFRLNAMYHESATAGRDLAENGRVGFAPSVSFGLGTETRLTLSYLRQEEDNQPDYGVPYLNGAPLQVSRDTFFGFVNDDFENTTTDNLTAKFEHDFSSSVSVANLTRYATADRESLVTPPRVHPTQPNTVNRERRYMDTTDELFVNQTDLTTRFFTGRIGHTLVTGVELGRQNFDQNRRTYTNQQDNLYNPDPYAPYTGTMTPSYSSEAQGDTIAVYAFDTIALNEQWEVSGGLRHDWFYADYDATNGDSFERDDRMLSHRAGVVYKPLPNGSVYVSYGTSFNPSAEAISLSTSNADLKPEKNRSVEAGTKWNVLGDKLALNAALFRTEKTNARTSDGQGGLTVLDGEQHVDGIELGATGQLTEQWDVFAGYTYMDSEIDRSRAVDAAGNPTETGNKIANVPENSFSFWTSYDLSDAVEIGAGALYIGERYNNNRNDAEAPGYWRFDAMASYDLTKNVEVRLNVYNIGNEEYYDRILGGHAVPGAGRSALLTTAFAF
jgi:catecholate siderophore receptor